MDILDQIEDAIQRYYKERYDYPNTIIIDKVMNTKLATLYPSYFYHMFFIISEDDMLIPKAGFVI